MYIPSISTKFRRSSCKIALTIRPSSHMQSWSLIGLHLSATCMSTILHVPSYIQKFLRNLFRGGRGIAYFSEHAVFWVGMLKGQEGEPVVAPQIMHVLSLRGSPQAFQNHEVVHVMLRIPNGRVLEQLVVCNQYVLRLGSDFSYTEKHAPGPFIPHPWYAEWQEM